MTSLDAAPISPEELSAFAEGGAEPEKFAPWDAPYLLLALSGDGPAPSPLLKAWARGATCVIIGLGAETHAFAALCDVVLHDRASADSMLVNISRAPMAALVLVQTLRVTENAPLETALTIESMAYATLQSGAEHIAWRAARPPLAAPSPPLEEGPPLLIGRAGARLGLVLNRPANRNAISVEMRDALAEAFGLAALDASIEEIALSGAGRCFSVGGDLAEFGLAPDPATAHAVRSVRSPARRLLACADRLHVRVHGACIGAGVELPAFAHRVTAQANAFFQLPEVSMGLIPGAGGCVSLPRRLGRRRTAYMALSGRRVSAPTALSWGLIDAIEP